MSIFLGIIALIGGVYFAGVEVWGVVEYLTAEQGGWTYVTAAGVGLAAIVSVLPAFAAMAWSGRKLLSLGLWCAFVAVLAIVIISGLTRTATTVDKAQQDREDVALARKTAVADEKAARGRLETDQANVDRECANVAKDKKGNAVGSAIGPQCKIAMSARDASQGVLDKAVATLRKTTGGTVDSLASRIAATGYMTEATFRTVWPLVIPVTTSLVSALLISLAVWLLGEGMPRQHIERPAEVVAPKPLTIEEAVAVAQSNPGRSRQAVIEAASNNVVTLRRPTPKRKAIARQPATSLMSFFGSCITPQDGGRIELADIYRAYAEHCKAKGVAAIKPDDFVEELRLLCNGLGIETQADDDGAYCVDVALKA